jgi:hypothetical protein
MDQLFVFTNVTCTQLLNASSEMKLPRGLEIGNAGNAVNSLVYSERPRVFLAAWWLRRGEFADITNSVISVKQLSSVPKVNHTNLYNTNHILRSFFHASRIARILNFSNQLER